MTVPARNHQPQPPVATLRCSTAIDKEVSKKMRFRLIATSAL
jgi:hypothetical protein